jgi:C4-dicarboxylate-specific signal transduction histidine kinase
MSRPVPSPEWLEAVNRLATAANQLSSVVHETNNLLQAISASAEMMEIIPHDSQQALERGRTIREYSHRASTLLDQVADLARPTIARLETLDLPELAASALELRKFAILRARVDTPIEVVDGPVLASANRRQTMLIVLNLLMNAERAVAGRAPATIRVRVSGSDGRAVLSVEDNGEGMPSRSVAETIADPPVVDKLGTRLGVGLRVAQALASQQGGTVEWQPGAAGGTVATLILPRA